MQSAMDAIADVLRDCVDQVVNNIADEQYLTTPRNYELLQPTRVCASTADTSMKESRKPLSETSKRKGERRKWKEQIDGFELFAQWEANQLEQPSTESEYFLSTHLYDFPYQEYIAKMRDEPNESLLKAADAKLKFVEEQLEERKQRVSELCDVKSCKDYEMFVCFLCGRAFDEELLMREHINEQHLSNEGYKFKCTQCFRRFKLKHHWQRHERLHDAMSRFACDRCTSSFSSHESLVVHRSRAHKLDEDGKLIETLKQECSRCSEMFGTVFELNRHEQYCVHTDHIKEQRKRRHKSEREQQHASASNSNIDQVSALSRPRLDNTCPVCHNKFASQQSLVRHLARKHPDHAAFAKKYKACNSPYYPFACTQCNKRFASKASLTLHGKRHSGDLPHKCPRCERCYPIASELKKHLITHEKRNASTPSDLNVL